MILPGATAGSASMDVLLHLHGSTPGYAGAKPDDEGVYRIEQQLAASERELIGVLPQGSASADFNAGKEDGAGGREAPTGIEPV